VVERTLIRPPNSRIGPVNDLERQGVMAQSPVAGLYDQSMNRESAYETLAARAEQKAAPPTAVPTGGPAGGLPGPAEDYREPSRRRPEPRYEDSYDDYAPEPRRRAPARRSSGRQSVGETLVKQVARTAGSAITREILRGIFGSMRRR
jgi:hypothetical protein